MTLDGIWDHTVGIPDNEIHQHYTELLRNADAILYGRTTYQLMEFWRPFIENPSDEKSMNDFAIAIDRIRKIVFSNTIKEVDWKTARLANQGLQETVLELKQQSGKDILIGSRSLIMQLLKLDLIDELQLCIYPMVEGKGLPLFEGVKDRMMLKRLRAKTFHSGAIILYYEPLKNTDHKI